MAYKEGSRAFLDAVCAMAKVQFLLIFGISWHILMSEILLINHLEKQASSNTFITFSRKQHNYFEWMGETTLSSFNEQLFNYVQVFP